MSRARATWECQAGSQPGGQSPDAHSYVFAEEWQRVSSSQSAPFYVVVGVWLVPENVSSQRIPRRREFLTTSDRRRRGCLVAKPKFKFVSIGLTDHSKHCGILLPNVRSAAARPRRLDIAACPCLLHWVFEVIGQSQATRAHAWLGAYRQYLSDQ